ncbi:hypothetical protein FGG08_000908 [Glutinoglossum americanum]|uniref:AB hydrolase-1 domain-containing protein n=1 Tax=Glutinoglossum americanum TaxID=1670608 RepID=A0A9P8I9B3_9PEZI|nr:hypothetical protein FGG08_000908 [Glutinoglossum americanum]
MDTATQAPVIPTRNPRHTERQRRRSLPPPSSYSAKPSPNRVNIKPASPEVISSLISSLSAISSPANHHFENFPISGPSHSTPSSPSAYSSTFPALGSGGSIRDLEFPDGGDLNPYLRIGLGDNRDHQFLHPDDAALPPVVRTSKHSSGLSAISTGASPAPDVPSARSHHRGSVRPGSRGSGSKPSKEKDDTWSIGSVSIERGTANRDSAASYSSTGSGSKKSGRHNMGLRYMGSKERMREIENERKRASVGAVGGRPEGLGLDTVGGGRLSLPPLGSELFIEDIISEEPAPHSPSHLTVGTSSNGTSPVVGKPSPIVGGRDMSPGGVGGSRYIPARRSSRQKTSRSPSKKQHSRRSSQADVSKEAKDYGEGSKAQDARSRHGETQAEVDIAKGERGRRERKDNGEFPPAIVTNHPPVKLRSPLGSPLGSPLFPQSEPANADAGSRTSRANQLDEIRGVGEEDSAPSPAIVQRKTRNSGTNSTNKSSKATRQSSTKTSLDLQWPLSPQAPRPNSRLKRYSQPSSPPTHRRSLSTQNSRTQEPHPSQLAPQVVIEDRPSSADSVDDAVDAYLCSPRLSQKIRHPQTGRVISFSEVGDSEGFAVFCCVGMGLTRYITAFYDELALTLKLRLITPDRPGVGESEPYADGTGTPLSWPDDVYAICQTLKITKFSILAHSAGAIYALATALRMPQHIRGRIHLLAPWIPPSQMAAIGSQQELPPAGAVPTSQRILRALPTPILKAANSSFMSATSSSITSSLPKTTRRKRPSGGRDTPAPTGRDTPALTGKRDSLLYPNSNSSVSPDLDMGQMTKATINPDDANSEAVILAAAASTLAEKERQTTYDTRLTHAIWSLATRGANPAVDLLVCLERRQTIGFRYVDITRSVVIHHGSRDTRVPVENVKWLGKTMRRCEVRILPGEGHGLMASASVMSGILMEVAKEWEDWMRVVHGRGSTGRRGTVGASGEWGG